MLTIYLAEGRRASAHYTLDHDARAHVLPRARTLCGRAVSPRDAPRRGGPTPSICRACQARLAPLPGFE